MLPLYIKNSTQLDQQAGKVIEQVCFMHVDACETKPDGAEWNLLHSRAFYLLAVFKVTEALPTIGTLKVRGWVNAVNLCTHQWWAVRMISWKRGFAPWIHFQQFPLLRCVLQWHQHYGFQDLYAAHKNCDSH